MAEVRAFRGVRYDERLHGEIGLLLAPPYDVLSPHLIERLRNLHPKNMVHLEHVEPEPGGDPHEHAAQLYQDWRRTGILARDAVPAFYRYDHRFTGNGRNLTRSGILAAVQLTDWADFHVLPHEATFPEPRIERLRRLRAVRANLSPLYLLSRDPDGIFQELLRTEIDQPPDVIGRDPEGEEHRLTVIADSEAQARIEGFLAGQRLYVADGHHRYEAALAYRDEQRSAHGLVKQPRPDGSGSAEFVLALVCPADDPGVLVLPTHRLLFGLPNFDPVAIRETLSGYFDMERLYMGDLDDTTVAALLADPLSVCLAAFAGEEALWRLRRRTSAPHEALMPNDRSPVWRDLNVAILGSAVIEGIFGIPRAQLPLHVAYAHDVGAALAALKEGNAQIAFFVRASSVDELMAVADTGETMPPKSTYFWPKVPAGLVIHELA